MQRHRQIQWRGKQVRLWRCKLKHRVNALESPNTLRLLFVSSKGVAEHRDKQIHEEHVQCEIQSIPERRHHETEHRVMVGVAPALFVRVTVDRPEGPDDALIPAFLLGGPKDGRERTTEAETHNAEEHTKLSGVPVHVNHRDEKCPEILRQLQHLQQPEVARQQVQRVQYEHVEVPKDDRHEEAFANNNPQQDGNLEDVQDIPHVDVVRERLFFLDLQDLDQSERHPPNEQQTPQQNCRQTFAVQNVP
mmetsp:Transcript_98326/g.278067  ORF Transcript_98326/g.278067 Transcript_98326/m.278067 type:complete len:248 (-) Transcript_98326:194-937(-)